MFCELSPSEYQLLDQSPDNRDSLLIALDDKQFPLEIREDRRERWFEDSSGNLAVCSYTQEECGFSSVARFEFRNEAWEPNEHIDERVCVR